MSWQDDTGHFAVSEVARSEDPVISWNWPAVLDWVRPWALVDGAETSLVQVGTAIVIVNSFESLTSC